MTSPSTDAPAPPDTPAPDAVARPAAGLAVPLAAEAPAARPRRLAELFLLLTVLAWAGNFVAIKAAVAVMPPVTTAFVRWTVAAAVLLVLVRIREGSVGLPRRDALALAGLGALGFGLYQILWTTALVWEPAGDSALLIASTPIWVVLVAVIARTDVATPGKIAGSLVSFTGVALVVWRDIGAGGAGTALGAAMTLGAAILWAVYIAFGADILRRHSPLRLTAWGLVAGAATLAPVAGAQFLTWDPSRMTPVVAGALAYSALVAGAIGNTVYAWAVQLIGPARASGFQFLTPLFAVLLAAALLGEAIGVIQVVGGTVIIAGVALMRLESAARLRPVPAGLATARRRAADAVLRSGGRGRSRP